jgi:hypothetical protein
MEMEITIMAHALEARSPLIDHRLAEWAAAVSAPSREPQYQG